MDLNIFCLNLHLFHQIPNLYLWFENCKIGYFVDVSCLNWIRLMNRGLYSSPNGNISLRMCIHYIHHLLDVTFCSTNLWHDVWFLVWLLLEIWFDEAADKICKGLNLHSSDAHKAFIFLSVQIEIFQSIIRLPSNLLKTSTLVNVFIHQN